MTPVDGSDFLNLEMIINEQPSIVLTYVIFINLIDINNKCGNINVQWMEQLINTESQP